MITKKYQITEDFLHIYYTLITERLLSELTGD